MGADKKSFDSQTSISTSDCRIKVTWFPLGTIYGSVLYIDQCFKMLLRLLDQVVFGDSVSLVLCELLEC